MFRVLMILGILVVFLVVVGNVWLKLIHPFLFQEEIEDKLDNAVEAKVLREADKAAAQILADEEATNVSKKNK